MILITGPLYSGKRDYARSLLKCSQEEFSQRAVCDAQEQVKECEDLCALADRLAQQELVIVTEVGGGVVPVDAQERAFRENAGRLSCMLAQRADVVVRVFCGIPIVMKGTLDR